MAESELEKRVATLEEQYAKLDRAFRAVIEQTLPPMIEDLARIRDELFAGGEIDE